ncbi:MAG: two-component regulator propeller domain-containing protein [Cytophagaceae bacterium]
MLKQCKISFYCTIFLVLTGIRFVIAQQYNFKNYSVGEGLPQSQVYGLAEDKMGNIWIGTRGGGVSRFDGLQFTNYNSSLGLIDNFVRCIVADSLKNLWIGTDKGLSVYNGKTFLNLDITKGLFNETVNTVCVADNGIVWLGTEKGIFHFDGDTIYRFGRKLNAPQERINFLLTDKKGNIWAGTEKGLICFSQENSAWKMNVYTRENGLPSNSITHFCEDDNGELWISTYGGGISRFNGNVFTNYSVKDGLPNNTVFSCIYDSAKNCYWIGTASGACKFFLNDNDPRFSVLTETEGLANNVVMSLLNDSFGNVWFGTSGGGLSKLDSERFIHFKPIKGVFGNFVYSICQDKDSVYWLATSEGGVTKYDGKVYKRFSEKDGFTAYKTKTICSDSSGNMVFGTAGDGAYYFDGKKFRKITSKSGLNFNFINHVVRDNKGKYWMATAGAGLYYEEKAGTGRFTNIRKKDGLNSDRVNCIFSDANNTLWVGTISGLNSIVPENSIYKIINYNNTPVSSANIRCISSDGKGTLYLGTAGKGLIIFDGRRFEYLNTQNGLSSNNIYSLLFDGIDLWVGTEKGIDRLRIEENNAVRHYGRNEGFAGIEAVQNASMKDLSGKLWFGTINGATYYNSVKDINNNVPPKLYLTAVQLFFENIVSSNDSDSGYHLPASLELPYDKNHLSFQFIGIDHRNPEAVQYSWKLENFDADWSPLSSRREAVYSSLPPGKYTFKIKARNELGSDSKEQPEFSFVITAPFWKTWWFNITGMFLLASFLGSIVFWRTQAGKKKLRQEKDKLILEKKMLELEQSSLRLQMNPHFLFNCLNSIKGLIAQNKTKEAGLYLTKYAQLMRAILDNSRMEYISIATEINAIKNYLELEQLSFSGQFNYSISSDSTIDQESTGIPPMLIQPFVENALLHGIAPKGSGTINVDFLKEGRCIKCIIKDNGIGRAASAKLKENSVHQHNSVAIELTSDRLKILNQTYGTNCQLNIIDMEGEAGTCVEITLPELLL